ncbi:MULTISPECIES: DinB family protein [unclassified Streptomyces]|uniref:DinB family protein n=1 Tax=Streptomyces evansiae TaxID=3075535 RepID=A0ABD5E293_9ACTN|nr:MULTISPECIES: DinB family protein [unclassified Streptomyces]ASY36832.1 mini-circle protein [Streptomyces sp. CLI2509]EFK99676.1 mini-circle protein [Streptomyces sp. SPB78]MDT0411688.1 DinB family protein [Streptomyces sp. DSM 41979]MDT0414420.1 DinB family protein [Streptomyces sp. DSM 41982]MDT0422798.1 DinB family protein [Streptomyces sp. DSM 41859]
MDKDSTEKEALSVFLAAQRASVLAVVAGLDTQALTTAVLPSGWTPLGLVEHLGYAERHWFQEVIRGKAEPLDWPEPPVRLTTPRPPETVFAFYADQCRISDEVLACTPLSSLTMGRHPEPMGAELDDVRGVVLHMIEETARHAGHLDAVRELIDGRTGLGPR